MNAQPFAATSRARTARAIAIVTGGMLAGALLTVAACGGGGATAGGATTDNAGPTAPAPQAMPPGSSGFPGLDWGDELAAVQAKYPAATPQGDGLLLRAPHGGRDAEITFTFGGGPLIYISVAYPEVFASMPACGEVFSQVRGALDATLGSSSEDNLAAYWTSDSASMTLTCGPTDDESEQAELAMSYSLPEEL